MCSIPLSNKDIYAVVEELEHAATEIAGIGMLLLLAFLQAVAVSRRGSENVVRLQSF